jgi:hypothetical protein
MDTGTRRSILTARILVETTNASQSEHDRTVAWAASRIKTAHQMIKLGYIAVDVRAEDGTRLGFADHGQEMSVETKEILEDFFEPDTDT